MPHTLSLRMMDLLRPTALTPCALTWDVLSHGLLPTTSSCAHAMDLNTPPLEPSSVDLPLFPSHSPTLKLARAETFFSAPGQRLTSVPMESLGGCKSISRF
eukprot:732881_1